MKKKLTLAVLNLLPSIAFAAPDPGATPVATGTLTINQIVLRVVDYILLFSSALAVLLIVVGGIRYLTSAGNPDAVEGAKKTLLYSIVGLLIVVLALVIVRIVTGFGTTIGN